MSIKGQRIAVRRSELHTQEDTVALWEVPVIEAVHDEGSVKVLAEVIMADRNLPDAVEEYQRLEARYKRARNDDGSFGDMVVANVYGKHGAGIQALKRAIQGAEVPAESLV